MHSCSPARIMASAISIARIDDAHTLLIVSAGVSIGSPAPTAAWRAGSLARAGLEHLAHDHVLRLARLETDASERRLDDVRAELRRLVAREPAAEAAEGRADGGDDDRAWSVHCGPA